MRVKVANYIADFLAEKGVSDFFTITGGGAMHLNDALGHHESIKCVYNHHEQASAIAAEAYTRMTGKIAGVCVTSGPGGTNTLTGVLGGWLDSIPMFIISGQVKRETTVWSTDVPLRQLGDQEFNIVDCVKTMTKYAYMITDENEIKYHLEKAWYLSQNGRGGPVWLDIPLDVQAAIIETESLESFDESELIVKESPVYVEEFSPMIIDKIKNAKKPVILAGSGIRLGGAYTEFLNFIDKIKIPVVTAWNSHDLIWDSHELYCGRPGTVGTRGGNFVVENSDLLIVLGSRLNIRQISYNFRDFAKDAYKIIIDIDENELKKPTIKADLPIHADVKDVLHSLNNYLVTKNGFGHEKWLEWCRSINKKYPAVVERYKGQNKPINPYVFMEKLFDELVEGDKIIASNGTACVVSFQVASLKRNQRLFTNSGCASMGYGLPAALGCSIALPNERIICLEGDGSLQMNLQELQTIKHNNLNIKILVINNNGYHSIRQTQNNIFGSPLVGVCEGNGISFPDLEKIAYAYDLPYKRVDNLVDIKNKIKEVITIDGPIICEVIVDEQQNFEPKLSSKVLEDGTIISPRIDDMFPFLDRVEYENNRFKVETD